jgi:F0F1-type ATP synthase epsilon subunit
MAQPTIHTIVKDKNGVVADEVVTAVTSYNQVGTFDVLPMHTNFITLIKTKLILHKIDRTEREIKVGTGLLQVINAEIHIYLGLPETSDDKSKKPESIAKPLTITTSQDNPTGSLTS